MKRYHLVVAILFLLLLTACGNMDAENTTIPSTAAVTEETAPKGAYVPESTIEQQTKGAVLQYLFADPQMRVLGFIGDKPVIVEEDSLTVLSPDVCAPASSVPIPEGLMLQEEIFRVTHRGIVYYDATACEAVFLDTQLQEEKRISLPGDLSSLPVFTEDGNAIFYAVGPDILSVDVEYGISRKVRTNSCTGQQLLGCYFSGKVLACKVEGSSKDGILYISGETGELLAEETELLKLNAYAERYFVQRNDGVIIQNIFGKTTDLPRQLTGIQGNWIAAVELDGALLETVEDTGLILQFVDLNKTEHTASVLIPGIRKPSAYFADRWNSCIWLLTTEEESGGTALLRWNYKESPVRQPMELTVTPVYTAENPDTAGLEACQSRVDALNSEQGVRIRIWGDAVRYTDGTVLEIEYQPEAITRCLDELEQVFLLLPENFLYKSVNSAIRICIVRSVDGQNAGKQFWYDGDAFIALPVGADIQEAFMNALGYVVDSHVLGNSPNYDYWNDHNPEGFVYGAEDTYSESYLEGEQRYFVDGASMQSATVDRSALFAQAVRENNKEMFASETMQNKLKHMCLAIRDAWRWERKTESYLWEQYLNEPVAYQK